MAQTLFHNTRTVIGRKGHPLAGAKSIRELAQAEWATTTIDFNAETDLNELFARYKMPPPVITLPTHSALSVMVALSSCDLLAILPAPDIVMIRRPDLPLTPAADHFCDLLKRYLPV